MQGTFSITPIKPVISRQCPAQPQAGISGYTILKSRSIPKWKTKKTITVMNTAAFSFFVKIFWSMETLPVRIGALRQISSERTRNQQGPLQPVLHGDERGKARLHSLEVMPGVESVVPILQPFKLASREFRSSASVVKVGAAEFGGSRLPVIAWPCSVESEEMVMQLVLLAKEAGASVLRGGAFKPRTSPYAFQGMGMEGLRLLAAARDATGLAVVTEVLKPEDVDLIAETADMLQVGARNVQNFPHLKRCGEVGKPVLLKRGMSTSLCEI